MSEKKRGMFSQPQKKASWNDTPWFLVLVHRRGWRSMKMISGAFLHPQVLPCTLWRDHGRVLVWALCEGQPGHPGWMIYIYIYISIVDTLQMGIRPHVYQSFGVEFHEFQVYLNSPAHSYLNPLPCHTTILLLMGGIQNNHLKCINPCKWWDKLPTSTGAGIQPSTVSPWIFVMWWWIVCEFPHSCTVKLYRGFYAWTPPPGRI